MILLFHFILFILHAKCLDIYVSNIVTNGDGSLIHPYSSIPNALSPSYTDTVVNIHISSNQQPYIIDVQLTTAYNLKISYDQVGTNPIIDFKANGSLTIKSQNYLILQNLQIYQSSAVYQLSLYPIYLNNASLLNLTNCLITTVNNNITLIYASATKLIVLFKTNITNLVFSKNLFDLYTVGLVSIDSCNFINSYFEGSYYFYISNSPLSLINSKFLNNTINQTDVGVTYSLLRTGNSVNISSTIFQNNLLLNTSLISIVNDDITKQILVNITSQVLVLANTQTLDMALGFSIIGQNIKVIIQDNVTFQYNYAPTSFLYVSNTLNTIDISNLYMMNNFGSEMIYLQLIQNISISHIQCLQNNDITASYYLVPSIIDSPGNCLSIVNYVNLNIFSSIFSNNFATSTLTGILVEHTSDISLLGVTADKGIALFDHIQCLNNVANATLSNLINEGNCFLLINSGSNTMTSSVVSNNVINVDLEAEYSGNPCLISMSNDNDLIITDTIFTGNKAYSECSCLNFHGTNFILSNVSFIENRSIKLQIGSDAPTFYVDNEGGCMNLGAATIQMNNVYIFNSSAMKGAGIFFHNKNSKNNQILNGVNITIRKNEGIQTAGIEFDASLILGDYTFINCTINENNVEFYGVISTFYYTSFNLYFYYCDISYNWGISAGAAFSFYHFGGLVYINSSTLIGNVLNESVFVGGAALFLYGTTYYTLIYVEDCKFIDNYSSLKGGAIQAMYGQVHARDSIFIDNVAVYGGAVSIAIYCPGSYTNIIVRSKYSVNQGGAFHFSEQSQVNLNNVSIYDCQASQGGGIYLDGSQMVFTYSDLSFYNVTADDGAAIWLLNTLAAETLLSNIYIQDSETKSTSLLNIDSVNILLTNLTVVRSQGRAIFINNSTMTLQGGSVIDHRCSGSDNQGCFAFIQEVSIITVNDLYFKNLYSEFIEDAFSISSTNISFYNISMDNCTTQADTILVTAVDSVVYLQNSILMQLRNALITITNTDLTILTCSFINISSTTSYGIIQINAGLDFLVDSTIFYGISGKYGGCISLLGGTTDYKYEITNTIVKFSKATQGAAFYVSEQNVVIKNSSFISNTVTDAGGSLYFDCATENNYQWQIYASSFINNSANEGGAYHSMRYIPYYDNLSEFINNSAQYGNDFSGFPIKLTLEINNTLIDCVIKPELCYLRTGITSGQTIPPLIISVLDYYGQKMTLLDGLGFLDLTTSSDDIQTSNTFGYDKFNENSANFRSEAVFTGVKTQRLVNGSFNFSEAVIQSQPPSNAWIKVKSDLIPNYFSDLIPNNTFFNWKDINTGDYNFLFKLYFRECVSGEVYFNNGTECNVCPKGKYSFYPSDVDCKTCPITAQCDGGNLFSLNTGYWRATETSDDVYECNILTDSCLGGINSSCLHGYTGIICGSCTFEGNDKFFKKGMYFCEECANVWIYIVIVVFAVLLIFGFIVFLITRKKNNTQNYVLVKIITNHVQTVSFLSNIKIEFPKFLKGFNSAQAPVTSIDSFVFTIECFKDAVSVSIYEVKLILSVIIALSVIFVVVITFVLIATLIKKSKWSRQDTRHHIISALVVIACFFQPPFINFYIQNLSCDSINNSQYMTYNLEQECWNKTHMTYSLLITIPFLIFWMVIFPSIFFIYMRKNVKNLRDSNVYQITKFFQDGYRKEVYYWEFVQMLRKFSVILLTTFLRNNPQSVVYILIPVIAFFFILQIANLPYEETNNLKYNFLEILSLNACFITYYSAVFYLRVISDASKTFFLIVILIANGFFLFFWVQKYLLVLKDRITGLLSTLKSNKESKESKMNSSIGTANNLMKSKLSNSTSKRMNVKTPNQEQSH